MDILVMALQLLLSLSLLVVTHEGGHFFFAKLFGIRVEKFYLFFDPWFSLFKFQKGETEYGIGWLPLGGYVKIAGMIDESMDTEQMAQPEQPWEFRSKPAWQRMLVMLGGVMVNFIEAPIIFWLMLFTWGESYVPLSEAKFGMEFSESLKNVGFQDGDVLVGVNGKVCERNVEIMNAILYEDACKVDILRDGNPLTIEFPHEFFREVLKNDDQKLFAFRVPVVVESVEPGSLAQSCGILAGDSIISLAGVPVHSIRDLSSVADTLRGADVQMVVGRSGSPVSLDVHVGDDAKFGFYYASPVRWLKAKTLSYGFFEAFPAGVARGYDMLMAYIRQLPMIFTKEGATKVGGFGSIGKMFPSSWNWESFWFNTAFLALILGFMNVLPIPALDGGHATFLLYEIVTGRKPSEKFMEYAQTAGMILLFALLIYANGADIVRFFLK